MSAQYKLENLFEMSLPEVHAAIVSGGVSMEVFADYVNICIAIGEAAQEAK